MSHFEKRVQLNKIIESQLPEFIVADFPKAVDFFKQYYISLEHQGGNVDLVDNLDRYIKVDNLVPEVIIGSTVLSSNIDKTDTTISVSSTKGFPDDYGLLKIDDEIITYTGKTDTSFTGCIRGFSGVTGYTKSIPNTIDHTNKESLEFSETKSAAHNSSATVTNLSVVFLQEFYRKLKATFTPGFEDLKFTDDLDVGNFIKHARNFYQSKGIAESIRILFKVLYGVYADVIDLEGRLVKPSSANYLRREVIVAENVQYLDPDTGLYVFGDPFKLEGQTISRSSDSNTSASVSEVEIFTRNGKAYYKLGIYVGNTDNEYIEGTFNIPGASRVVESVSPDDSIITVDSTIGFGQTGTIVAGQPGDPNFIGLNNPNVTTSLLSPSIVSPNTLITYTSKSINQFYGCVGAGRTSGIGANILLGDLIRDNDTVVGYENGDATKKVELRLTGVLSEFESIEDIPLMEEGEEISVLNLGEAIQNPSEGQTYKQVFANSWIYNTSTRYIAEDVNGSVFSLGYRAEIEESALKVGDLVEIVYGNVGVGTVAFPSSPGGTFPTVSSIDYLNNTVTLTNTSGFQPLSTRSYSIRRKLVKANSSGAELKYGNNKQVSNTLNVYTNNEGTEGYVASNSLPGYTIKEDILQESVVGVSPTDGLSDYDNFFQSYNRVTFKLPVNFRSGDEIVYTSDNPYSGLTSGQSYFIKLISSRDIKIYLSSELLESGEHIKLGPNLNAGTHKFTLKQHGTEKIADNKILRKFPLNPPQNDSKLDIREQGSVGVLIDGVEITSPDSTDKIYYGPLKSFDVLNGGKDYDVVSPPEIEITAGLSGQAKVQAVVEGSVKEVYVDPQDFDVKNVSSISLVGGNGSGCELQAVVGNRFRELKFDSRRLALGGGIDTTNETITFLKDHNLVNGQIIIYNQNGNEPLGIGDAYDSNNIVTSNLATGDQYYVRVVNPSTIRLFKTEADALASVTGINTIGLAEATSAAGIHKFRTESKKNIRNIKVINSGSGYSNRKLRVKDSNISTIYDTVTFKDHGFNSGDIVDYKTTGTEIVGLSTANQYSIVKIDADRFKLINVGVAGTYRTDITKSKITKLNSNGTGYQIFEYPPIKVEATFEGNGTFEFTPVITGPIVDAYLYESGSGYGSTTFNIHKKPISKIKKGKNAQLNPIIVNGKIEEVQILNKGKDYTSTPDITIEDPSGGVGAILRPVMKEGKIDDVIVINTGLGYNESTTSIFVDLRGTGAIIDTTVRELHINDAFRFGSDPNKGIFASLSQNKKEDHLNYGIYGYSKTLAEKIEPLDGLHSPIIGWAYDGNPIYGPFAYGDPDVVQSGIIQVKSGYQLNISNVIDRPNFAPGFFVEDYSYTGSGNLDKHNGRYCKTPEFPNGTYAYFAGVKNDGTSGFIPEYPYFIGDTFKSNLIKENVYLDHEFDFNSSLLVRNTLPYNVNLPTIEYDFLNESYETFEQPSVIEAITKGSVPDIQIIDGGKGYKINDAVNFDFEGSNGFGLRGQVTELTGAGISSITTSLEEYPNSVFVWDNEGEISAYYRNGGYNLKDNQNVIVSGLSTSISRLKGSKKVKLNTEIVSLASTMSSYGAGQGPLTETIYVSSRFDTISIGNSITVKSSDGTEIVKVLNDYGNGILKVKRFSTGPGAGHSLGSVLELNPDRIVLPVVTDKFTSERNDQVYFNAFKQVAIGVTQGAAITLNPIQLPDGTYQSVSVPTRTIYIPNHPFKAGQKVKLSAPSTATPITVSKTASSTNFFLPDAVTRESDVYIIDKGPNHIGLATQLADTTASDGVFFKLAGGDNDEFLLESKKTQVTGNVSKVTTIVSTSATHGLQNNDLIKLTVKPNTVVGLGTTAAARIKVDLTDNNLIVNPLNIPSSNINPASNILTYNSHGFETGDKVYYESNDAAAGLALSCYYVIKVSDNEFQLAETKYDTADKVEYPVDITSSGTGIHTVGLINPRINVIRNSDLTFDLSDESLKGYQLKIYNEKEFINEFVTTSDSADFNVTTEGTIGIGTTGTASLKLEYSESLPSKLYYALEKNGYISTSDTSIAHYSEINFLDSEYNGSYEVFGVDPASPKTFKISPYRYPSVSYYQASDCDVLSYNTKSSNALNGKIANVKVISEGYNFEVLPKFKDVTSENGRNANLVGVSSEIGRIKTLRFKDVGYDYPSDKTLRPEAGIPPIVSIDNLDIYKGANIISAGARYLNSPNILLWNETRNQIVDSTSLVAEAPFGAIANIVQLAPIFGLESEPHKIICVDNSNGVGITSMLTGPAGIATCTLETPVLGFDIRPFNVGDKIFVEGIQQAVDGVGDGYNSKDYDYRFFEVTDFADTSPATLEFSIVDENGVGLTTNPGFAKTFQDGFATLVNSKNYPVIDVIQERGEFVRNEQLYVSRPVSIGENPTWGERDLYVSVIRDDFIKVKGRYNLKKGELIKGFISGVIAEITDVDRKHARFNIDYSSKINIGWSDDIGKLSEDYQVVPDNDYYQNLSYSVKSSVTWDQQRSPVNSLVHPAGLKNFADVEVQSSGSSRVSLGGTTSAIIVLDVIGERRVDIINNFDNAVDDTPRLNPLNLNVEQSNRLRIQNKKLNDYVECKTNRALVHDDISDKFSSRGFKDRFVELDVIDFLDNNVRYLVQIQDPDTGDIQLSELAYQSTTLDSFLFEKQTSFSNEKLGNFEADIDDDGRRTLKFAPTDPFDRDHDIKVIKKTYLYQGLPLGQSGIGTESFGSIDVTGSFVAGITAQGTSNNIKTIKEFDTSDFNGAFANIEVADELGRINIIEAIINFDGVDTYLSEYYFDTTALSYSASQTGIVKAIHDPSAGTVSIKVENLGTSSVGSLTVRSNIIGFGTVTSGIGTYRFLLNNQPPETERSGLLESTVGVGTGVVRVGTFNFDLISSSSSIVRVSVGQTSAIHQIYALANSVEKDVVVVNGPFANVNSVTGLGTFGSEVSGDDYFINFYPDSSYHDGDDITVQAYNEVFYREMDFDNQALPLEYGPSSKLLYLSAFDGINGLRANRVNFPLTHEGKPIYNKSFDPTLNIDYATGVFTYPDHFFNTGEELIYTPRSTFEGIGQTAMGIGTTENYLGITTNKLPDRVFAIAITPDSFQLATKEEYARAGIAVTFIDVGEGNAHELEFTKKLSKTVIGIDGIVQQPITFTPISHTLIHNGHYFSGGIPAGINTFNVSGISSIQPRDLLRIDDEYMKVESVGFTSNTNGEILGPISGVIRSGVGETHQTVSVVRGSVGSAATSHIDGSKIQLYRGSFNIVKNEIFFTDPPKGNTRARRNEQNLPYVSAKFSGRTFLRSDYSENMIFDDNSHEFSGIGRTYTMKVGGLDTTGVSPGNGILFINGVFQTPSTENNTGNNYDIVSDVNAGITSVIYTGITSVDGTKIISEFDINQNQVPRGGLIVSLGSTPGLGYAPLYGASLLVDKNSSGELTNIVGVNTYRNPVGIIAAEYDKVSGLLRVKTSDSHNLRSSERVKLNNLLFECDSGGGPSTQIFPDYDFALDIYNIISATELTVAVGPSTITHVYQSGGDISKYYDLSFGSGYRSPVSIGVTDFAYEHKFVRAGSDSITDNNNATYTATNATYTPDSGVLVLQIGTHSLNTSNTIQIDVDSLIFTCSEDNFFTEQPYPRSTDPAAGQNLQITAFDSDSITVNVGPSGGSGTGAVVEATVGIGGTLSFNITNPGTGYINPRLIIPEPNYENMEVVGVSRLGVGATTKVGENLLLNLQIGPTSDAANEDRFFDAANLILSNTAFIADVAYGRMIAAFPSFNVPTGNPQDCKDDIVDVLESLAYNLKYGGNDLTFDAANLYITGAHVAGEEQETIRAFEEARDIATQVMRNEAVITGGHTTRTQIFDLTITYDTAAYTPTNASYTSSNGNFTITIPNHGFQNGDQVKLVDNSFTFTCTKDNDATLHTYPRPTDPAGSQSTTNVTGYLTISNVTTNTFRVNVGASPSGQQYVHTFVSAEVGAVIYKLSSTTTPAQCANVQSAIHTLVGIVTFAVGNSTLPTRTVAPGAQFSVSDFKVSRSGYGFKPGDVMKVAGLVTAKDYTQPVADFELEVLETFSDAFSSWSFGELDFIDSIAGYQNGTRKRFPLFYKGELLSFETNPANPLSVSINLDAVLLIFVNGVLQTPGDSYKFTGGTSFIFEEAPQPQDKVDIFFYVGQDNVDAINIDVQSTVKVGDDLFVGKNPQFSTPAQNNSRTLTAIRGADTVETEIYTGLGVDENNFRPVDWIKQKNDMYVRGNLVTKARDVYEPKIFPTAKIIGDVSPTDTEIFVDNAQFFVYDNIILDVNKSSSFEFDAFFGEEREVAPAEFTTTVSTSGTVSSISIDNVGSGYTVSSLDIKLSAPKLIGVGVGTTATATATITNGQVSSVTITNPGLGYTTTNPPLTIIESPRTPTERLTEVSNVQGFSGIITGISTCPGTGGHPLALKFNFTALLDYAILGGKFNVAPDTNDLQVGYPVLIYDTTIGHGVTSVDSDNNAVVGIGSTFLDNVYKVHAKSGLLEDGEIICNIHTDSPVVGLLSTGSWSRDETGICTHLGRISFGRIYNFDERTNGIGIGVTGLTVDAGLSSFPSIQRRGDFGEQKSGGIRSRKPPESGVPLEQDNYFPFYAQ